MDCDKVADLSLPDVAVLAPARHDLSAWLERLGCKLHPRDRPLVQYVSWCHQLGILKLLSNGPVSIPDVCRLTKLNEAGADALLGVLCGTSIAGRRPDGGYFLRADSRE
jgi:hypothetical protein